MSILRELEFLYTPAPDFEASLSFYREVLGGDLLWRIKDNGTSVACLRVSTGPPMVLLASHLQESNPVWIYRVLDLDEAVAQMIAAGSNPDSGPIELPQGPCYIFHDPSGQKIALYQETRPDAYVNLVGRFDE